MNVKRIFGTILTVSGIGGLVYAGAMVVQQSGQVRELIVVKGKSSTAEQIAF